MPKKIIRLRVDDYHCRVDIVNGLAHSGYAVWTDEEKGKNTRPSKYYVCFETAPRKATP
jgi:hypothetical protein